MSESIIFIQIFFYFLKTIPIPQINSILQFIPQFHNNLNDVFYKKNSKFIPHFHVNHVTI